MSDPVHTQPTVDVQKLSLRDIGQAIKRLSLASALWLGGLVIACGSVMLQTGRSLEAKATSDSLKVITSRLESAQLALRRSDSVRTDEEEFDDWFGRSLADPRLLNAVADGFARERPDGIRDREELGRLIGWQLLAQRGKASFYRSDSVFRVLLRRDRDGTGLLWRSEESVIADAGRRLGLRLDRTAYARINAEMNRGVVATISATHSAVRIRTGGISIVGRDGR